MSRNKKESGRNYQLKFSKSVAAHENGKITYSLFPGKQRLRSKKSVETRTYMYSKSNNANSYYLATVL